MEPAKTVRTILVGEVVIDRKMKTDFRHSWFLRRSVNTKQYYYLVFRIVGAKRQERKDERQSNFEVKENLIMEEGISWEQIGRKADRTVK